MLLTVRQLSEEQEKLEQEGGPDMYVDFQLFYFHFDKYFYEPLIPKKHINVPSSLKAAFHFDRFVRGPKRAIVFSIHE